MGLELEADLDYVEGGDDEAEGGKGVSGGAEVTGLAEGRGRTGRRDRPWRPQPRPRASSPHP